MRFLTLGSHTAPLIAAAKSFAAAHPVTRDSFASEWGDTLPPKADYTIELDDGYHVTYCIENTPDGVFAHLMVSTDDELPSATAMALLSITFGCTRRHVGWNQWSDGSVRHITQKL